MQFNPSGEGKGAFQAGCFCGAELEPSGDRLARMCLELVIRIILAIVSELNGARKGFRIVLTECDGSISTCNWMGILIIESVPFCVGLSHHCIARAVLNVCFSLVEWIVK